MKGMHKHSFLIPRGKLRASSGGNGHWPTKPDADQNGAVGRPSFSSYFFQETGSVSLLGPRDPTD